MIQRICLFLFVLSVTPLLSQFPVEHMTKPELTRYTETSSHADVISFLDYVKNNHNNLHLETMLISIEGKDVPLAVLANPGITTPEEAIESGEKMLAEAKKY